jgi:glutamate 5-kinase
MSRAQSKARALVAKARRIVVKVGSSTLASDAAAHARIAADIAALVGAKRSVVLVSSGAIALGVRKLGWARRPKEIGKLQAAAAAGQSLLMRAYEESFGAHGVPVAQVLLTHADLADRTRANNARAALGELIAAGAVPILNENDSVAVEEIKFGDNDQLAAMVAPLVDADLLVLLSDVPGVLDGQGARVPVVGDVAEILPFIRSSTSSVGTGGMGSKVEAARRATLAGASAIVADARAHGILAAIARGDDVGTLFTPAASALSARKYWIAFTLRPRGDVVLDAGAARAVKQGGKSVLAVGVLGVRGHFGAGDAVRLLDAQGAELGRGLARLPVDEAARIAGRKADGDADGVLVHRDELVLF